MLARLGAVILSAGVAVGVAGCGSARICTDGLFTVQTSTRTMHGDGVYLKNMTWAECQALRDELGQMP